MAVKNIREVARHGRKNSRFRHYSDTLLDFLESDWHKPDEGIWEVRGPQRQFTHSKVMAWVAMDRAVKSVEEFGLDGEASKWRRLRSEIHEDICREGFDPAVNSFVQYYGSKEPDASLLMLPLVGFLPATDPRMRGTVDHIQRRLVRHGFVDRYAPAPHVDGLPAGEGAFLLCTFWLADNLALQGRYDEARDIFERLLNLRNDVGVAAHVRPRKSGPAEVWTFRSTSDGRKLSSGFLPCWLDQHRAQPGQTRRASRGPTKPNGSTHRVKAIGRAPFV